MNRLTEDANTGELTLCPVDAALGRAGPTPRLGSTVELWYWYWCREVSPEEMSMGELTPSPAYAVWEGRPL